MSEMGDMHTWKDLYDALKRVGLRWESISQTGGYRQFSLTSWQDIREVSDALESAGFTVESVESDPDQNMMTLAWFDIP